MERTIRYTGKRTRLPAYVIEIPCTDPAIFFETVADGTTQFYEQTSTGSLSMPALLSRTNGIGDAVPSKELTPVQVEPISSGDACVCLLKEIGLTFETVFNKFRSNPTDVQLDCTLKYIDVLMYHITHRYLYSWGGAVIATGYAFRNIEIAAELYDECGYAISIKDIAENSPKMRRIKSALHALRNNEHEDTSEYYELSTAKGVRSLSDFQVGT